MVILFSLNCSGFKLEFLLTSTSPIADHITSESANFESVLSLLSSFFVPEDENALLSWVEKVASDRKLRSKMQQWRQDWKRLVSSGQNMQALL